MSGSSEIFPQPQPLEPPAIAFDGTSLVVAFTAFVGAEYRVFASRYDRENETWETPEPISDAATAPAQRMPQLHADGRGNLTVVWAASTVATGSFNLAYQRFDGQAAAWSGPELIAGTTFESPEFNDGDSSFALGGNADGLAAVAFFESKLAGIVTLTDLRLASFY